jgi:hypothetical protein
MSNFAKGKYAKAISDRSGMEFPYNEMVTEWNGSRVHVSEFEPKQPQLELQVHGADPEALKDIRADRTEPATERLLPFNAFTYPVGETFVKIFEPGHGRSTGDTVRFRNVTGADTVILNSANDTSGRTITVIDDDFYSYSIGLAPNRTIIFGGGRATSGPVTISP